MTNEDDGVVDPRNTLNCLTGRQWIRATKSWFVLNPPKRDPAVMEHPATYPPELCEEFIAFFSKPGELIFDPFCGVGNTLVAAERLGRYGVGFDIEPVYVEETNRRVGRTARAYHHDACRILEFEYFRAPMGEERITFTMTSPPYLDMLSRSRGGSDSARRGRERKGLDTDYPLSPGNLAACADLTRYEGDLVNIFTQVWHCTRVGGHMCVVLQNIRTEDNEVLPVAWAIAARIMASTPWSFQGERVWCQDNKPLGIWGYPKRFVSNIHHHYCLLFQKVER